MPETIKTEVMGGGETIAKTTIRGGQVVGRGTMTRLKWVQDRYNYHRLGLVAHGTPYAESLTIGREMAEAEWLKEAVR